MTELFRDPKIITLAVLSGVIPAIFWLWFWLKEESQDSPEPIGLVVVSFVLGAIIVFIAIALEKYSLNFIKDETTKIISWAVIEEILKLLGVAVVVFGNRNIHRPIDYPMFFIATALGFAALENFLYLVNPFNASGTVVGMLTGNLRFLGSTLLHAMSSAIIGNAIGLYVYLKKYRVIYLFSGIVSAIALHSVFNFFIMEGSGENFLSVFGFLWVVTIINILIFEKLKRMGRDIHVVAN